MGLYGMLKRFWQTKFCLLHMTCQMSRGTLYDWLHSHVDVSKVVGLKWVVFCLVVELARGVGYLVGLPLLVYVHRV